MSVLDKKILRYLIMNFDRYEKRRKTSYLTGFKKARFNKSISYFLANRGEKVHTKVVGYIKNLTSKRKLIKYLNSNHIFYSLGYQEIAKYINIGDYPNLKSSLTRVMEFPIENNEY